MNEYDTYALDYAVTGIALNTESKDFSSVKLRGVPVNTITKSRELCTIFFELRGCGFYDNENYLSVNLGSNSIITIDFDTGEMSASFKYANYAGIK